MILMPLWQRKALTAKLITPSSNYAGIKRATESRAALSSANSLAFVRNVSSQLNLCTAFTFALCKFMTLMCLTLWSLCLFSLWELLSREYERSIQMRVIFGSKIWCFCAMQLAARINGDTEKSNVFSEICERTLGHICYSAKNAPCSTPESGPCVSGDVKATCDPLGRNCPWNVSKRAGEIARVSHQATSAYLRIRDGKDLVTWGVMREEKRVVSSVEKRNSRWGRRKRVLKLIRVTSIYIYGVT